MSAEYSVEEVLAEAHRHGDHVADMLTAYADLLERIEADEGAVAVDAMRASLIKALMAYRCTRTVDEDGEPLPLVDALSPGECGTIQHGLEEIEYLAEYLADELPPSHTHPARSGVVRDEDVRDAERLKEIVRRAEKVGFRRVRFELRFDPLTDTDLSLIDYIDAAIAAQGQGKAQPDECNHEWVDYVYAEYRPQGRVFVQGESNIERYVRIGLMCTTCGKEKPAPAASPAGAPDVKSMVDRFLGWRLPADFAPDCGISFKPITNPAWTHDSWPIGTNLFTAAQAEQMFRYVLAASASQAPIYYCTYCKLPSHTDTDHADCEDAAASRAMLAATSSPGESNTADQEADR